MKKMIRISSVLLLLALLSACSKSDAVQSSSTVLKWWVWATVDIAKTMSEVVFENEPALRDKYEIQPELIANSSEVTKKLRLMIASNETMPEIVMFQSEFIPEFSQSGALTDLSDIIGPMKDKLTDGAYSLVTYKGKQWALPYQIKPRVWIYRQDMFEKAGIELEPDQVISLDDFLNIGKKFKSVFPDSYLWHIGVNEGDTAILLRTLSGNGASFFDDNGNYIVDKDPGVRAAFRDLKKIYDADLILNVPQDSNDMIQAFANGTIASDLTGSWIKNNIQKWAPDLSGKWAETQWPTIGEGSRGGEGGSLWVLPKKSKNNEAAIEFMSKLVLTKEGSIGAFQARSIYPSLIEAIKDPIVQEPHSYVGASLPIAEAKATQSFENFNYSINYSNEMRIVNQYFAVYLQNLMTLDEALKAANNDLINQIGNAFE